MISFARVVRLFSCIRRAQQGKTDLRGRRFPRVRAGEEGSKL